MNDFVKIFKALGNDTRFRIFLMLKYKTLCVCEVREIIGCSMATLSNHLKLLKDAGLIISNKNNKYMNYQLNHENENVKKLLGIMAECSECKMDNDKKEVETVDREVICKK